MKKLSIKTLAQAIDAGFDENRTEVFSDISIDSRTNKAGDCFFAIAGPNFDGHDFVGQAFAKGAVCAVVSRDVNVPDGAGLLKVPDTIKALGQFARWYRSRSAFKVIAITGSVGKTTTRHIIYQVLSRRFRCHQAPQNYNNNIGLPITLLGAEPDTQFVVTELGTNAPGEIAYLSKIARPDIAVITNICPAHLEGLGTLEAVAEEKLSIREGLNPPACLIINTDNDYLFHNCTSQKIAFIGFGRTARAQIVARNVRLDGFTCRFSLEGNDVFLPLPGSGNVENALAAWAVCKQVGLSVEEFAATLKEISPAQGRSRVLNLGTLTVIDDCYNANPASMKNALEILSGSGGGNRRLVFICGDMAELGRESRAWHEQLGLWVAEAGVNLLVAVGPLAAITAETAAKKVNGSFRAKCFADADSVCNCLQKLVKDYDILLVKGSHSTHLDKVVAKLKELYPAPTAGS